MHIKSLVHNMMISPKTSCLAGFELGSFVPEEDAMSIAPRRQDNIIFFTNAIFREY
jgi:hypothetical protein